MIFALMLIVGIQITNNLEVANKGQVLGYASDITISGLLSATNSERSSSGKSALTINSKLNTSAQGKANHMIDNNYWAHTSPGGVTPWYWFDYAGYDYIMAGENLAYGFDTSSGVVAGWMASPSHRDNMLSGSYEHVGFGIANGNNFQGGPNTVVVAHYGDPAVLSESSEPEPAAAPAQSQSDPTPTSQPVTQPSVPVTQAEEPEPKKTQKEVPNTEEPISESGQTSEELNNQPIEIAPTDAKRISNLEALLTGQATWALYSVATISILIGFVYLYRHVIFIHKAIIKGEKYLVHHPLLEASIIYALIWLLLAGTFGSIL